mgnify:CR=1 FL=1
MKFEEPKIEATEGVIEVFSQNCSDLGDEVYLTVRDFQMEDAKQGVATAILSADEARALARRLLELADSCDEFNSDPTNYVRG